MSVVPAKNLRWDVLYIVNAIKWRVVAFVHFFLVFIRLLKAFIAISYQKVEISLTKNQIECYFAEEELNSPMQ